MQRILILSILVIASLSLLAQEQGFKFGEVTYRDIEMKSYPLDSSASAVMLNEFGEAYFNEESNLLFYYHAKIKILKKEGLKYADIEIPLYKGDGGDQEKANLINASSFTFINGSMRETKVGKEGIFHENKNKYWGTEKIAIPNVQVGSVIEYEYQIETPARFVFKFKSWEFQSDIPKVYSEYCPKIMGNYVYNISLKGFLQLSKNENEIIPDCITFGTASSACILYKLGMKDIPAFKEEEFMTSKANYISTINFELSEIKTTDGRIIKYTKDWKDVELDLKHDEKFGSQIKRGKNIVDEHIDVIAAVAADSLTKAKKIYDFIKYWYSWDGNYSKYSEFGIKKAFDTKKGNVGDINLTLIAALKYAGLNVEPLLLSTRENGYPTELHPVLSDFNYVIAKLNLNGKVYLLDATEDYLPFGMIPIRCLNGEGRVLAEKGSYWYDLASSYKSKEISTYTLKLDEKGSITGTIQRTYFGYEAFFRRISMSDFKGEKEFVDDLNSKSKNTKIVAFEFQNVKELEKPLSEKFEVEIESIDGVGGPNFLFNLFLDSQFKENPFKSIERVYPVDYGCAQDYVSLISLEYPEAYQIDNLPEKNAGMALPNNGGRFIYNFQNTGNKVTLNSSFQISKPIFTSTEYHYLKEFYSRIIQIQNADLIFKKVEH